MFSKLPSSLSVKEVANQGNGIFAKKFTQRGNAILKNMPYSFGIGGVTVEDVRGSCHHCLKIVRDKASSVVCSSCKVVGYCSEACLTSAVPLHSMECNGLAKLEQLRGKVPEMNPEIDGCVYWPPTEVQIIARAINRRILQRGNYHDDEWLVYLSRQNMTPDMAALYPLTKRFVRYLVPSHVSDDEIHSTYRAVSINSADVMCPRGTAAAAIYFEYSLLNHMCQPNCGFENDDTAVSVYAIQDIQPDTQLCISYLNPRDRINVREIRRKALKKSFGFDCVCSVCLDEEIVGTKFWLLDQQKRSLIAPWSREYANKIMNIGWEAVCKYESMERLPAIQLLESILAIQKSVLDKRNISLILTVWRLLRSYCLLPDSKMVFYHLQQSLGIVGISAFFEYATIGEIEEIIIRLVVKSCKQLGLNKEVDHIEKMFINFFPKVPTSDMLHIAVGSDIPPSLVKLFQEKYVEEAKTHDVELYELVSCILNVCDRALN